ncbi:MAG: zf-HC2 domain-containing protein [Candidatus Cloacimonadales bacterium]|nr:zf-HC2 domain-containing protein [Candidatus Cloacimonadales bacterium]
MKQRKCRFSHKLNAFSDGELSKQEFEKVQNHLQECPACQSELREIVNINSFLSLYQEEEVPEYLNQRILAAVRETEQEKVKFGFHRQLVQFSIAASVLISFVAGILMSDLAYTKAYAETTTSNLELGQETLYSYFEGGE